MRQIIEISLDLTTQELLDVPADADLTEIEDICALDLAGEVANTELECNAASIEAPVAAATDAPEDGAVEIELTLTPQELQALLNGEWKP